MEVKTKLILQIHSRSEIPYQTRLKELITAALRQGGDSSRKPGKSHA
ncbi:MAG: hypothetical protein U0L92_08295 [Clostridia bacterium]|nr:hypothetical protein [Clostridia bacterium]